MIHIPFAFFKKGGVLSPFPSLGNLVINSGQTVDIAEGSVYVYDSITINAGGTLRITGNTGAWTEIGCKGNMIVNGTILARAGYDGQATHSGGTFTRTSSFGLGVLSYSITQAAGGGGGNGGNTVYATGGTGGAQSNGIGGGGGGGGSSDNLAGLGNRGGDGGVANGGGLGAGSNGGTPTGGTGASNGGAGAIRNGNTAGGGGGGGYKGHHGKGIVIYVEGQLSGSGSIDVSGRSGFAAGSGGGSIFTTSVNSNHGGGGGGGAGGSGGSVKIKYTSGTMPTVLTAGGAGGAGGTVRATTNGYGAPVAGGNGANGAAGSSQVLT